MHPRIVRILNMTGVIFITLFIFAVTDYMKSKIKWGNMFIFYSILFLIGIVIVSLTDPRIDEDKC